MYADPYNNGGKIRLLNKMGDFLTNSPVRLFQHADDKIAVQSGVIKDYFITHHSSFTEFNGVIFHEEYHNDMGKKIMTAENTLSDAFILKSQALATAKAEEASKVLVKSIGKIKFAVNSRFSDDSGIMAEFRLDKLGELSKSVDKFIGYSKDVLVVVDKYKVELAEEGLKQEQVDQIKLQITTLDTKRREQVQAIQSRPVHTKNRIDAMNALWLMLVDIRNVADNIFADQPEIRSLFQLPKHSHSSSVEEDDVSEDIAAISDEIETSSDDIILNGSEEGEE